MITKKRFWLKNWRPKQSLMEQKEEVLPGMQYAPAKKADSVEPVDESPLDGCALNREMTAKAWLLKHIDLQGHCGPRLLQLTHHPRS